MSKIRWLLTGLALTYALTVEPAIAQAIVPAQDGTNTIVTPNGNRLDISGGQLSGDGANLFHSFAQFGLTQEQVANFLSNPSIENILARVTGGNASIINGLIQVSGGNSNLYLMNPAGIIFGSNSSLNVPASFTATTASGIGINSSWFNATGGNDYSSLVGTPNTFAFTMTQPGVIINAGNLGVGEGQNLTLVGGTVVNTGQLSAPGGTITLAAVLGESVVRISQQGNLLNLEIAPPTDTQPSNWTLPIATLPQLLTGGGEVGSATGMTVNEDGTVMLTGSGIGIPTTVGTAIASGTLDTRSEVGGNVFVLGSNVGVLGANINANGTNSGGTVRIGGDYQGSGTVPNAIHTVVSNDSLINANALVEGNGGRVIVWSDQDTVFDGNISARGGSDGGNGGFVEVSGKENLQFAGLVDTLAANGQAGTLLLDPKDIVIQANGQAPIQGNSLFSDNPIGTSSISGANLAAAINAGNVTLQANNDITVDDDVTATTFGNGLTLQAGRSISFVEGRILTLNSGNFSATINDENAFQNVGAVFRDAGTAQFFMDVNSQLLTNGGNVTISPGTFGGVAVGEVSLNNATINSGSGNISITGTRTTGIRVDNNGISLANGSVLETSGTGAITLNGTAGAGTDANDGIQIISNSRVTSVNGSINLTGTSNGTGADNRGIVVEDGSVVQSTGTGTISLTGTGGNGDGARNRGIVISGTNSGVSAADGDITLTGTGGNGTDDNNDGIVILLTGGTGVSSVNGNITLTGASGNGNSSSSQGIELNAEAVVASTGSGTITFQGTSNAGGTSNTGIFIGNDVGNTGARVSSASGNISIRGTGNGAGTNDYGIFLSNNGVVQSTGSGTITLEGSNPNGAAGIQFEDSFINPTGGSGAVTLTADEINLIGTTQIRGSNILQLQPLTSSLGITLGGTTSNASLNLDTAELSTLQNGFSQILIGRADSTGAITLTGNTTFNDPVIVRSPIGSGSINTTGFTLTGADDATITLLANQDITTGNITNSGREITLTSTSGNIDTSAGIIDSSSTTGNGGAIALSALNGSITASTLNSWSQTTSGNAGEGGEITLNAANDINITNEINSFSEASSGSSGIGGAISLTTTNGNINTGILNSFSNALNGTANNGGAITLSATSGNINTSNLFSFSNAPSGSAGNGGITQLSANTITTGNIQSFSLASTGSGSNGGAIAFNATNGIISGNLDSSGFTNGGGITMAASTQITAGDINSSGNLGTGGNVAVNSSDDIQVNFINAQGGTTGGTVGIATSNLFRAINSFTTANCANASICTADGATGGSITIQHGGSITTPFIIGSLSQNGTAGAIITGLASLSNLTIPVPPAIFTQGNIQIITVAPSPTPSPTPQIPDLSGISLDFERTRIPSLGEIVVNNDEDILQVLLPSTTREEIESLLDQDKISEAALLIDTLYTEELSVYIDRRLTLEVQSIAQMQQRLNAIASQTGKKPAIIYTFARPEQLDLVLVTPSGPPIYKSIPAANREVLLQTIKEMRSQITNPAKIRTTSYLKSSQQLYQWIIAPLEADLQAQGINTLVFSMDTGLRAIPLAALHDGNQFLVEKYSLGLIPSLNLTDTRYQSLKDARILAMGASQFVEENPLPAVPVELSTIVSEIWSGKSFLNEAFTLDNLKSQRANEPFGIIHLATHGEFQPGQPNNSFIQLWNSKLRLDQLRQLGWNNPPVELLVLSACRTALGDEQAELGFAGFAVQAGVKSAVASLWSVSDEGTLGLMTEFYQQLKKTPIKAEGLRQAQLAMIKGEVRLEGGQLRSGGENVSLPADLMNRGDRTLNHPYYWAAFTLIGSPW